MKHFLKLPGMVDTAALATALHLHPELWNAHAGRRDYARSPHAETADIWLRYNDLEALDEAHYAEWTKQHDSVWHPAAEKLPQLRPIVFSLMARVEATRLGGVLITKVPPGKSVRPHVDRGWHPDYYNVKLYVPLAANEKCVNRVEDERVSMRVGEVWYFDNTKVHEVVNGGDTDRITLIICLHVERAAAQRLTEQAVKHHFAHGLYAKEMQMPAGFSADKHVHDYPHFSYLGSGSVRVEVEGEAPFSPERGALITIAAGKKHRIVALEDSRWYCIHGTDETDVSKIDEVLIRRT